MEVVGQTFKVFTPKPALTPAPSDVAPLNHSIVTLDGPKFEGENLQASSVADHVPLFLAGGVTANEPD